MSSLSITLKSVKMNAKRGRARCTSGKTLELREDWVQEDKADDVARAPEDLFSLVFQRPLYLQFKASPLVHPLYIALAHDYTSYMLV